MRVSQSSLPGAAAGLLAAALLGACASAGAHRSASSAAMRTAGPPTAGGELAPNTPRAETAPTTLASGRVAGGADLVVPAAATIACFDRIPRAAYTRVAVYGVTATSDSTLSPRARHQLLGAADALLQSVAERVRATLRGEHASAVDSLPFGERTLGDSLHVWRGVGGALELTAHRDGQVSWSIPPSAQGDTTAVSLLARTLESMRSSGDAMVAWASDPSVLTPEFAHFEFSLVWTTVDSAGRSQQPALDRRAEPLFSMLTPWFEAVSAKKLASPDYPDAALSDGFAGTVIMQFVVNTAGRAESRTAHDLWPADKPPLD